LPVFWTGVARPRSAALLKQLHAFTRTDRFVRASTFRLARPFDPVDEERNRHFRLSRLSRTVRRFGAPFPEFSSRCFVHRTSCSPFGCSRCSRTRLIIRRSRTFVLRAEHLRSAFALRIRSVLCPPSASPAKLCDDLSAPAQPRACLLLGVLSHLGDHA
jgi:hypothetical protein